MARKWTLGQFSRFVSSAESKYGFSRAEAREMYHEMKEATGKPVFASALRGRSLVADEAARTVRISKEEKEFWEKQHIPEDFDEGFAYEFEDEDEY